MVVLNELEHDLFRRDGANLIMEKDITLYEALCGFSFTLQHLDERVLVIKNQPGAVIKPGDIKEIQGEGMPIHKRPFDKGLLVIKFNVIFPENVAPHHTPALREVLPHPTTPDVPPPGAIVDEYAVEDFGTASANGMDASNDHREAYHSDEDERGGGAQRVDCAQQ